MFRTGGNHFLPRRTFSPGTFFSPEHSFTRRSGFILPCLEFLNLDALNALKKTAGGGMEKSVKTKKKRWERVQVQNSRSVPL